MGGGLCDYTLHKIHTRGQEGARFCEGFLSGTIAHNRGDSIIVAGSSGVRDTIRGGASKIPHADGDQNHQDPSAEGDI